MNDERKFAKCIFDISNEREQRPFAFSEAVKRSKCSAKFGLKILDKWIKLGYWECIQGITPLGWLTYEGYLVLEKSFYKS